MAEHAILSPSSASRWLTCTPSARLEQTYPDRSSDAADEGTTAHKVAEIELRFWFGQIKRAQYEREIAEVKKSKYYSVDMQHHVDDYVAYIDEVFNGFGPGAKIFFEVRLDITTWIPQCFGTGDVVIVADGVAHMIDLKYGKGVRVSAKDNKQLKIYSLGVVHHFGLIYGFRIIRATIYQPRIDNIATDEYDADTLIGWADTELKPAARIAFEGIGKFVPGDHCGFCRAAGQCRALADYNIQLTKLEFGMMTVDETVEVLNAAGRIRSWLKSVEKHALLTALDGSVKWPGFKVVEGRSTREWTIASGAIAMLIAMGYRDSQIYEPAELKSPAQVEKAIGKKNMPEIAGVIRKPPGRPALVPSDDPRPEFNSAKIDFAEFAETDD